MIASRTLSALVLAFALTVPGLACDSTTDATPDPGGGGDGSTTGTDGGPGGPGPGDGSGASGSCESDPLRTGLVAQQTGVSADAFDCAILKAATKYAEPDPMIFKAIIYVESRFDATSVACPNLPCGMPAGWTDAESRCYGLMQ